MGKRISEEEITSLRELTEQVERENEQFEVLPPSKRKVRNYLFITQCVMVVILCFAYFPFFLLGIGMSIITFKWGFHTIYVFFICGSRTRVYRYMGNSAHSILYLSVY